MATAWERVKRAVTTRFFCIRAPWGPPRTAAGGVSSDDEEAERTLSSRLSKSGRPTSTKICAICLSGMRSGHGQALFTAECSHAFHFQCISSSVQHGNHVCPICRALWRELPFRGPIHGEARTNFVLSRRGQLPAFRAPEPDIFDDDQRITVQSGSPGGGEDASVEIMPYTEFPAIQRSMAHQAFDILVRLKAPVSPAAVRTCGGIDLVVATDVGESMEGNNLELMKRAVRFVIQSLGPDDRLCVIPFNTSAWRLFPLRKMTAFGRQQALQAVNDLTANNGSNIADAMAKAARVLQDRQARNPVCAIILLSSGQDTRCRRDRRGQNFGKYVPFSICPGSGHHVRIHVFCLSEGYDSAGIRAVAEISGGTFSFIDSVRSIEGALAPCISRLLGVVAQEIRLNVDCAEHGVLVTSIKSGAYASRVDGDGRGGFVDVGDLYADEEKDFLVTVHVPPALRKDSALIVPSCTYRAAVTMDTVHVEGEPVVVHRPAHRPVNPTTSCKVERERRRIHAMEGMAEARDAAEQGDFAQAAAILRDHRRKIEPRPPLPADLKILALVAELREMQDRVVTRRRYEESGRAYLRASLRSHTWQRATVPGGCSTAELAGLTGTYQTPCMLDMLNRSQVILPEAVEEMNRSPTPTIAQSSIYSSDDHVARSMTGELEVGIDVPKHYFQSWKELTSWSHGHRCS